MQTAEAKEKAAEETAAQRAAEAAGAQQQVAEVEREMQALLAAMERQKRASAAKVITGSSASAWQGGPRCAHACDADRLSSTLLRRGYL